MSGFPDIFGLLWRQPTEAEVAVFQSSVRGGNRPDWYIAETDSGFALAFYDMTTSLQSVIPDRIRWYTDDLAEDGQQGYVEFFLDGQPS